MEVAYTRTKDPFSGNTVSITFYGLPYEEYNTAFWSELREVCEARCLLACCPYFVLFSRIHPTVSCSEAV